MANGQQLAKVYLDRFIAWKDSQNEEDYKAIIFNRKLHRGKIAEAIGSSKSVLTQNSKIKTELQSLEKELRDKGVLPSLSPKEKNTSETKVIDSIELIEDKASQKLSYLEVENMELRVLLSEKEKEILELRDKLNEIEVASERFTELNDSIFELEVLPR